MRLPVEHIKRIASLVVKNLKEKELVRFKVDEGEIRRRIEEIILQNMKEEEELDREVERILKSHAAEIEKGGADYKKMFRMVKQKLARERNFIL